MAKDRARDPLDDTEALDETPQRLPRGHLVVLSGDQAGTRVAVDDARVVIGSGDDAGLRLDDRAASRRHAEVLRSTEGFLLRDLGSKNGTFVNGNRVREVFLKPGDVIAIGRTELKFEPRHEEVRVAPSARDRFGPLYGGSPAMRRLFGVLERVAAGEATVLVNGETGTGKDLVARAIHEASPRATKPLIVFDCSAVNPELIGSELFGHQEGAFTGAKSRRAGAFEAAHGGTIFLDEIGELPPDLQPMLLRALENRQVRPLGSNNPVNVDCRVIAATHRDLTRMVAAGKFREDLYYRLAVVRVTLPPLAQRPEDVPGLVAALLAGGRSGRPVTFSPAALARLARHAWPGNVRELRNVIDRSVALSTGEVIGPDDLAFDTLAPDESDAPVPVAPAPAAPPPPSAPATLEEMERQAILDALARCGGNQKEAARLLGIHRNTMANKIKALGIDPERGRK